MDKSPAFDFELSKVRLQTRRKNDMGIKDATEEVYQKWAEKIRSKSGEWVEVRRPDLGNFPRIQDQSRGYILYRLQKHPNIISRNVETAINGTRLAERIQPIAFCWVSEEEKRAKKFRAYAVKNVPAEYLDYLELHIKDTQLDYGDILQVVSALVSNGADKEWTIIDIMSLTIQNMQPIDITINVIRELYKAGIIYLHSFREINQRNYKLRRLACRLSFSEEEARTLDKAEPDDIIESAKKHRQILEEAKAIKKQKKIGPNELKQNLKKMRQERLDNFTEELGNIENFQIMKSKIEKSDKLVKLSENKGLKVSSYKVKSLKAIDRLKRFDIIIDELQKVNTEIDEELTAKDYEIAVLKEELEHTRSVAKQINKANAAGSGELLSDTEYNKVFQDNAKDVSMIMTRHIIKEVEKYVENLDAGPKDELSIARLEENIRTLANNAMNSVINFKSGN